MGVREERGERERQGDLLTFSEQRFSSREKKRAHSLRSCRHTIPSETQNHYLCCCMWAAADDVPKTLVRTLGKFVKLMHDNNQTAKVAKACHSGYNTQLTFKPPGLRYGGDKLSHRGCIKP